MNRDLVFFLSGLGFGLVGGYFVFLSLGPGKVAAPAVPERGGPAESSAIGLDGAAAPRELDVAEAERLEALADENSEDPTVRADLGKLYLDAGRFDEAVRWLGSAVELAPRDLELRTRLALAQLNAGDLDGTVSTYEGSLAVDPEHPASLLGLGRVRLYLLQDIEGGLSMWKKLVAVAPESAEALSVRDELDALQSAHSGGVGSASRPGS